jgi:GTP-binding protein EngB required for normal cell division
VLAENGHGEEAARVHDRMVAALGAPASLVAVGEISRGKSTLVNALLGIEGLAPTGYAETTAVSLTFAPADEETPAGSARIDFPDGSRIVPHSELADWVSLDGEAFRSAGDNAPVSAVVGVESAVFPGVVVVDTPGTGGLNQAFTQQATLRAEKASVLLFVTDAGGRISSHSLEFLRACVASVAAVVVVVNKIDKTRQWRDVVAEDREILARELPGSHIEVVGVSALRAVQSASASGEAAERLADASRIDDVRSLLARHFDRIDSFAQANALQQYRMLLDSSATRAESEKLAAEGSVSSLAAITERSERLEELRGFSHDWRFEWSAIVDELGAGCRQEISARVRRLRDDWKDRTSRSVFGVGAQKAALLRAEFAASVDVLAAEVDSLIVYRSVEALHRLYAVGEMVPSPDLVGSIGSAGFGAGDLDARGGPARPGDPRALVGFAFMGAGAARLVAPGMAVPGIAGASAGLLPVMGIGAVAAVGLGLVLLRRQSAAASLNQQLEATTGELREALERRLGSVLSTIRSRGMKEFSHALNDQVASAKRDLDTARSMRTASESERRKRQSAAIATVQDIRSALDVVVVELDRLVGNVRDSSTLQ